MVVEVRTKSWGNSIGIVIPSETVSKLNIKPNESVFIEVRKKDNALKELFGSMKTKKPSEQIIKEAREDTESKWLN